MNSWAILIFGAAAFLGMLSFLRLVACELERAAQRLKMAELTVRRALARDSGETSNEVVVAQAA